MEIFDYCPNCNVEEDGASIYKCDDCGLEFCQLCRAGLDIAVMADVARCPHCNGLGWCIGDIEE